MYNELGQNFYSISLRYIKIAKQRTLLAVSIFIILFIILLVRLTYVMIINGGAEQLYNSSVPILISRADIVDRNGAIIATSLPTVSLYACPHEIFDVNEAAEKISAVFSLLDKNDLIKKLSSSKKFLWIKRHLSPKQEQTILNQGIPGLHFLKTERRVYPDKNLISHVVGGTDIDNIGIAGIEKVFGDALRESSRPIILSIDMKVQYAVHDELQKGLTEFSAIAGGAVVMEIATGEIIAMLSLPDFDPNKNSNPSERNRFNIITSSAIEPGSSAKIFNTTMALDSGKVTPFSQFDARFPIKIGRFTIHDFKGRGTFLSVEEILKYSSNIGSAKVAMAVGAAAQKNFFRHIGLLDTINCELPETQRPIYPRHWSDISAMTIAFGHGIAFSPLHLITVFSGIINDGIIQLPTLLMRKMQSPGRRIISSKTSKQMQALIRLNVTEGTNKFAEVPGYCVGGKSGTAEKQKGGKYLKHSNYCGFIGAFPMTAPKYAVYVVLDDPKVTPKTHGYVAAGWNAAPIAAKIIKRIAPMLGVIPSNDKEPNWKEILKKETMKGK